MEHRPLSRRQVLAGGAAAAGIWVAPSIVGLDRVAAAEPSNGYSLLYSEDFEGLVGMPGVAAWNNTSTAAPTNSNRILGRFGSTEVILRMQLPRHECVRVCFDLFVNDSWDGTNPQYGGPDQFGFAIDGSTLWDEPYDMANVPAGGTLIAGPALLWFTNRWNDRVIRYCVDVAHTNSVIQFSFFGTGLQRPDDESWGLDNVEVFVG